MLASLKGWRTVIVNAFFVVDGVILAIDPELIRPYLPQNKAWIIGALAIANIVMRAATSTGIGRKE